MSTLYTFAPRPALWLLLSLLVGGCHTETHNYVPAPSIGTTGGGEGTSGSEGTTGGEGSSDSNTPDTAVPPAAPDTNPPPSGTGGSTGNGGTEIPTTTGEDCGPITVAGCCEGDILKYCNNNQLKALDCTIGKPPNCGWDQTFYNCENNNGMDPSGTHPMSCP